MGALILSCNGIVESFMFVYSCWSYGNDDDVRQVGRISEGFFLIKIHKIHYLSLAGLPSSHSSGARAGPVLPTSLVFLSLSLRSRVREEPSVG